MRTISSLEVNGEPHWELHKLKSAQGTEHTSNCVFSAVNTDPDSDADVKLVKSAPYSEGDLREVFMCDVEDKRERPYVTGGRCAVRAHKRICCTHKRKGPTSIPGKIPWCISATSQRARFWVLCEWRRYLVLCPVGGNPVREAVSATRNLLKELPHSRNRERGTVSSGQIRHRENNAWERTRGGEPRLD